MGKMNLQNPLQYNIQLMPPPKKFIQAPQKPSKQKPRIPRGKCCRIQSVLRHQPTLKLQQVRNPNGPTTAILLSNELGRQLPEPLQYPWRVIDSAIGIGEWEAKNKKKGHRQFIGVPLG